MDDAIRLLAVQDQLITRAQLVASGVSRAALRWKLERGTWREVLPGIFAGVTGTLTRRQRALAAQLYGGAGAQLTGAFALTVHGLRYVPPDPYLRVLVPRTQQRRSAGFVRLHRTDRLDRRAHRYHPLVLASPARAVADAARWCQDRRAVRALVADVVQRRLATVERLQSELDQAPRNGTALLRAAVAEVAEGVRSVAEAHLRELVDRSHVVPPKGILWNPHPISARDGRSLPTPDGWIPEVGLALEVDSREYHSSPEGWARTVDRHNVLARHGALVLHFLPSRIQREPGKVLSSVEDAYLERRRSGARAAIHVADRP